MKKFAFLLAAAAVILSSACSKTEEVIMDSGETGLLSLSIKQAGLDTKVDAYSDLLDEEKAIKKVQILIFNAGKELERYLNVGAETSIDNIRVTTGAKWVFVVANGPDLSGITTYDELWTMSFNLEDNGSEKGFTMCGTQYIKEIFPDTYRKGGNECSVGISRLVSRIALVSIENGLPDDMGDLKIERVFLSNVVSQENKVFDSSDNKNREWINKQGRADESTRDASHIIDGKNYLASLPDLTYKEVGRTLAKKETYDEKMLFYAFPNPSKNSPNGFTTNYTDQQTVLVIVATLNGKLQYYPLPLDQKLTRNSTNTIAVSIKGAGSTDPNKEEKTYIKMNITGTEWSTTNTYGEPACYDVEL